MKNIAVLGTGKWGINFLRIFKNLKSLNCFYDINKNIIKNFIFKTKDSILKDKIIKIIIISTPINTHFDLAREFILNKKHILVEKPLVTSIKELKILKKLSKKYNIKVMCGYILIYHPIFIKIQRIINSNYIGKILRIYSIRTCPDVGLYSIIWDYAPHDISLVFKLLNASHLKADILSFKFFNNILSQLLIKIVYKNIKIKIFLSFNYKRKERRFKIFGAEKIILFDDIKFLKNKLIILDKKNNIFKVKYLNKEPLLNECQYFLESIKKNKKFLTDIDNSKKIIKLIKNLEDKIKIYK